jgi:glutamate transport system permease protein
MTVLYDVPGPVTRRRTAIGTVVAGVALVGLMVLVLVQPKNSARLI